jgi:hypothetical protein
MEQIMSGRCKACNSDLESFNDPELCPECVGVVASILNDDPQAFFPDEWDHFRSVEEVPAFEDFDDSYGEFNDVQD